MSATKDGGPAFPVSVAQPYGDGWMEVGGMTLRDWFAGQALVGILALPEPGVDWRPDIAARNAYRQADAMLAAREGGAK